MDTLHAKRGHIYIIGCLMRPGALTFATELEYKYYTPNTDLNEAYNIFRIQYAETPFFIIEVPGASTDRTIIDTLSASLNLKLQNGKPYNVNSGEFSLACDSQSCFTLETLDHSKIPKDQRAHLVKEYELAKARC
jgi:hypothetical protein